MIRFEEAQATVVEAMARKADSSDLRLDLYQIAFLKGNPSAMQEQLIWGAQNPSVEDWFLDNEASSFAYFGQLRKARVFGLNLSLRLSSRNKTSWRQAIERDSRSGKLDRKFGRRATRRYCHATNFDGPGCPIWSSDCVRLIGDADRVQTLAHDLDDRFPENTVVQLITYQPCEHILHSAEMMLCKRLGSCTVAPFDLGQPDVVGVSPPLYPVYLRGLAYFSCP